MAAAAAVVVVVVVVDDVFDVAAVAADSTAFAAVASFVFVVQRDLCRPSVTLQLLMVLHL